MLRSPMLYTIKNYDFWFHVEHDMYCEEELNQALLILYYNNARDEGFSTWSMSYRHTE